MQHDSEHDTLSWLFSILNDKQPGSSTTPSADAAIVELICKLLLREDYVSVVGQLKHAEDAKNLLDFMLHLLRNRWLSSPNATMDINQRARRLMFKIISKMPIIPSSLFVTGVSMPVNREYIGGGGFGQILKGELSGKAVALKLLYKTDNGVAFCREALMWRSLDHNLVLPFLGIHEDECASQFFLVSPYMKNGTLAQWRKKANPSIVDIEERMLELAHGIEYIHSEGVVHGDLRGANILLDDKLHVQIADFGLTRLSEATNTRSGALHLNFAAPELFGLSGNEDDLSNDTPARTQMSDVYAFGCVYYEIYYDSIPFVGKQDTQIWALIFRGILPSRLDEPPLSDGAWDVIQHCWERKPSERPNMKDAKERMMALYQSAFIPTNARNPFYYEMLRRLSSQPLTSSTTQLKDNVMGSPNPIMSTPSNSALPKRERKRTRERTPAQMDKNRDKERGHERKRKREKERNRENTVADIPPSRIEALPRPLQGAFIDGSNIFTVPDEYRREGSDWYAVFNPKVKRVLDIQLVHKLMHESVVCCVRFSPDGEYLATGCNRTAQVFNTKTGTKICALTHGQEGDLYIRSVCFSPDGKLLATGAEDKKIRIWHIAKKGNPRVLDGHQHEIYSLEFSPDGRVLVSGSGDKTVRIWDMSSLESPPKVLTDPESLNNDSGVTSVSISPNGRFVAAGSLDTVVRMWDVETGALVERLEGHRDSVYSVAFTPDDKGLVSGSLDRTLKFWDVGRLSMSDANRKGGPGGSTTGPGTSGQGTVMKIDGKEGSPCTMNFIGHKDYVLSVAISHDGRWVVSGSEDRGVQFWDTRSAAVQCMLQGHKNSVISVGLSPMGGLLATGSGDWQARIWSYKPFSFEPMIF
ncbi:WD40-repeat-containing domain protein [Amanita rubescens]|nr:WD40-repeat-containing domain protein [Amanita rubescens]